jgi:hypothetical protein
MAELKPIPKGELIEDSIIKHIDKRFLSSVDLIGMGAVTLTIDRVEKVAELRYGTGESDKNALLIYFKETPKPLKLCKTNVKNIIYALGTAKASEWGGKKITLEVKTVQSFGKQVPAVRVKV